MALSNWMGYYDADEFEKYTQTEPMVDGFTKFNNRL
jgi:hypothetical protein